VGAVKDPSSDMTFSTPFPCGATLDIVCPKRSAYSNRRASDNVKNGTAAAQNAPPPNAGRINALYRYEHSNLPLSWGPV